MDGYTNPLEMSKKYYTMEKVKQEIELQRLEKQCETQKSASTLIEDKTERKID